MQGSKECVAPLDSYLFLKEYVGMQPIRDRHSTLLYSEFSQAMTSPTPIHTVKMNCPQVSALTLPLKRVKENPNCHKNLQLGLDTEAAETGQMNA